MIYDIWDNLEQYTGLFEHLDTAIAYLAATDLSALPLGRTEIDGDNVYLTICECEARSSEDALFETHSAYMDIHIDLEGIELVETALGDLEEVEAYQEDTDSTLYRADLSAACVLGPERFFIAMTEEPHKPAVATSYGHHLKKCIVKVRR